MLKREDASNSSITDTRDKKDARTQTGRTTDSRGHSLDTETADPD